MNFSGIDTPEYKIVLRLAPELRTAVQDDLCEISDLLLSRGMITEERHEEFTDSRSAISHVRASSMIRTILNKIKADSSNFDTFVGVLEVKEWYYESVLNKLKTHREELGVTTQSTLSQSPAFDLEQSDSETSNLLRLSTPYIQFGEEEHSQSLEPHHRRIDRGIQIDPCGALGVLFCTIVLSMPLFIIYATGCRRIVYTIYLLHLIGGLSLPTLCVIFLIYFFLVDNTIVLFTFYASTGILTVFSWLYFSMYYCS